MKVVAPREENAERGGLEVVQSDAPGPLFPFTADPMVPVQPTRPGWRWHRLTSLARLATGHTPSRRCPEYWNGDIPWLQLPDIRALDGHRALDTLEHTNELGIKNSAAVLLPQGTVCLSRTASVGFVTVMGRPMATSQDFVNWVCGPDLSPEFLKWLFIACRKPIRDLGSGAVHQTIYFPTVEQFAVCIPPLAEQERIAGRLTEQLGAVERARAAAAQRLAAAESLPAALLREVFEGPQASGWETRRVDDVCDLLPSKSIASDGDTEVRAITTACLTERGFRPEGIKTARMRAADVPVSTARAGELLIARSNTSDLVGRASLYLGEPEGIVASDLTIRLRARGGEGGAIPDYLAAYMSFLFQTGYWKERAGGASGSMKKITREQLSAEMVPVPPLPTQRRLAAELTKKLAAAEGVIARCREELAAIESLPASLLRDAFGGAKSRG